MSLVKRWVLGRGRLGVRFKTPQFRIIFRVTFRDRFAWLDFRGICSGSSSRHAYRSYGYGKDLKVKCKLE